MRQSRVIGPALLLALLGLAACQGPAKDSWASAPGRPEPVSIIGRSHGVDPGFKTPMVRVFNSKAELAEAGSADVIKMDVDFARHSVLVLAQGQRPTAGYWARITGVQRLGAELFVQGLANAPDKGAPAAQVLTYPYDAVVIPRTQSMTIHPEIESVTGQADPVGRPTGATGGPAPKPAK